MLLAEQFGIALIEDDYDHEFQFDHRPMLPLASADHGHKVIYIGSMSKLLTPSLSRLRAVRESESAELGNRPKKMCCRRSTYSLPPMEKCCIFSPCATMPTTTRRTPRPSRNPWQRRD